VLSKYATIFLKCAFPKLHQNRTLQNKSFLPLIFIQLIDIKTQMLFYLFFYLLLQYHVVELYSIFKLLNAQLPYFEIHLLSQINFTLICLALVQEFT